MSVGDQLGLDDNSELLEQARQRWTTWVAMDARLGVVENFDDLRGWLPTVDRETADEVLVVLAMLGAPDGGDDIAAAAALAKCLLPGACTLAAWLCTRPDRSSVLRDNQPVTPGAWSMVQRIDELVAAQLWIEVRTFPWRRLRKVAANILMNTRAGVLRECGDQFQVARFDRTWAHTDLVEAFATGDFATDEAWREYPISTRQVRAASFRPGLLADPAPAPDEDQSPLEELLEVLAWACEQQVISADDRYLLLCLVDEASRVETRRTGRGYGGLMANELSVRVAPRVGVSESTVRRRASRSMRALAAAVPTRFGDQ
ncbi:MAG: hypothetical protein GEV10_31690 [Streptosporangiales bacterium]|nr:hypothetical protein [Streptosporangiales bacterium]